MKRFAILSTALCVMLSGCTTEQPLNDDTTPNIESGTPSESAADKPQAQAFVFKSGVLEIGDFDPYTIGDDIFDPCTEITKEEFAAAGFEDVEPLPEKYAAFARGMSACDSQNGDELFPPAFMSSNANRKVVAEQVELFDYKSEVLPTLYTFGPLSGIGPSCYAQIDTVRGAITTIVAGIEGFGDRKQNCDRAINALESLYQAFH